MSLKKDSFCAQLPLLSPSRRDRLLRDYLDGRWLECIAVLPAANDANKMNRRATGTSGSNRNAIATSVPCPALVVNSLAVSVNLSTVVPDISFHDRRAHLVCRERVLHRGQFDLTYPGGFRLNSK